MSQTLTHTRVRGRRVALQERRTLRWRMAATPALAALIVTLGAVGIDLAWENRYAGHDVAPLPAEAAPGPAPAPAPTPAPEPADDLLVAAAMNAVESWGRFASTGDLAEVGATFVPNGPQYRQFEQEAADRQATRGGPPYEFTLSDAVVLEERPEGDRVVRGDLQLTREGNPAQHYRWDLRLRQGGDGTWRVWTVINAAG
jgi:hypothetical protein